MKLNIDDIPDEGLSIAAETAKDDWLRQIFNRALHEQIAPEDALKLTLTASLIGDQVECMGGFYYTLHPVCARCGSRFLLTEQLPLYHHYIAVSAVGAGPDIRREEEIDVAEDEDFSVYEGRTIDIDPMLYEHLILAQPVVYLCREDCKGLCPRCGTNLNEWPCDCKPVAPKRSFEALKGIRVDKKR